MKKEIVVLAMALLVATSAFAGNVGDTRVDGDGNAIGIGIDNNTEVVTDVVATGGNAISDATATGGDATATVGDITVDVEGGDASGQTNNQTVSMKTPTQLMNLQYGTNFVNPGLGIQNKGWAIYHSAVYSFLSHDEVERMKKKFALADLFSSRVRLQMVNERISGKPAGVSIMNYWPKDVANKRDRVIASLTVKGEANWPEESFLGLAADACIEEAGSDRIAVLFTTDYNGVTNGKSISIGGATSSVFSDGRKGAVMATGGQLGTIETSVEEHNSFKVLCMNPGPLNYYPVQQPKSEPPVAEKPVTSTTQPAAQPAPAQGSVVKQADPRPTEGTLNINVTCKTEPAPAASAAVPPPAKVADALKCSNETIAKFNESVKKHSGEIESCDRWSFNNLTKRLERAYDYIELYACTRNVQYLRLAENDYQIAESNHQLGWDIPKHQVEADKLMADGYMLWAGVTYILHGQDALNDFVVRKRIEDGRKVPTEFNP